MNIKNNNQQVISRLAKNSYRNNRSRNYLLIVAVAMVITLLFTIISVSLAQVDIEYMMYLRSSGNNVSVTLENPTLEQYQQIQELDYIDVVGKKSIIGVGLHEGEYAFAADVLDSTAYKELYCPAYSNIVGEYPTKENEVMLPIRAFENLGINNLELHQEITLDIELEDEEIESKSFVVSGYYTEYVDPHEELPRGYFSVAYLETLGYSFDTPDVLVMKQKNSVLFEEVEEQLYQDIETTDDIQQFVAVDTISYAVFESIYGDYDVAIVLSIIIIISAILLMSNIMQISLEKDVRELGLLRTIGTTKKQIFHIVRKQIMYIVTIGAMIGTVVATTITVFVLPQILAKFKMRYDISAADILAFKPTVLVIIIIFAFIVCSISMLLPLKRVYRISPREALYYMEGKIRKGKKQIQHRKGTSITRLSWRNISKNRVRLVKTISSLFVASILTLSSIMAVDILDYSNAFEDNPDFRVQMSFYNYETTDEMLQSGAIDNEFLEYVKGIKGVNDVTVAYQAYAKFEASESVWQPLVKAGNLSEEAKEWYEGGFRIIDNQEVESLTKWIEKNNLDFDMEKFSKGESFINLHHHAFSEKMNQEAEVVKGEQATFYTLDKEAIMQMEFGGYLDIDSRGLPSFKGMSTNSKYYPYILISESGFEKLGLTKAISHIDIMIEEGKDLIIEAILLNKLQSKMNTMDDEQAHSQSLDVFSKYRMIQNARDYIYSIKVMLFSISALLMVMAIFNYFNVMHTSLVSRKKELATLESIGMTRKQLRRMLVMEGVLYNGIVTILIGTVGTVALYLASNFIQSGKAKSVFTYPTINVLILITAMFIIAICLPLYMYRRIQKQSVIQQINQ